MADVFMGYFPDDRLENRRKIYTNNSVYDEKYPRCPSTFTHDGREEQCVGGREHMDPDNHAGITMKWGKEDANIPTRSEGEEAPSTS